MKKILLAIGSAAIMAGGAWASYLEAGPYFAGAPGNGARLDRLLQGHLSAGISLESLRFLINECAWALTSPYGVLLPTRTRLAVAVQCGQMADGVKKSSLTLSSAWLLAAYAAAARNDIEAMNSNLLVAHATEPTGQRIAALRVWLAENHYAQLTEEVRAANQKDLALLVLSNDGIASIAERYVTQSDSRARIAGIVESLPARDQRRFISYVERATASRRAAGERQ